MIAQDPAELFDLYDESGRPLGRTKARSDVHRDGDWHRSLHLWVVSRPRGEVILQRRGEDKDTWPRRIDVAVAGHYGAGEGLAEVLRESDEEIGLVVRPEDAVRLGTRHCAGVDAGIRETRDNEIQDIFATWTEAVLEDLRPGAGEVDALFAVPLGELAALVRGERSEIPARGRGADGTPFDARIGLRDFVPCPDGYWQLAIESLDAPPRGDRPLPWILRP